MRKILSVIFLILSLIVLAKLSISKDKSLKELKPLYFNSSSQFMELDSRKIHFRDEGSGYPIILIHGTGASLHTWDSWTKELKETNRVIRLDLPAFGLTGKDRFKRYSAENYVSLLNDFLKRLKVKEFHLAGNSLGGLIAWLYTSKYDEKVNKLLLLNPSGFSSKRTPFVIKLARTPILNLFLKYFTPRLFIEKNLKEVYYDNSLITDETISRYYDLTLFEGNRSAFIDRANINHEDYSLKLQDIKTPTLILWGENDEWIPVENSLKFKNAIKNSKVVIMSKTGHIPMEEKPSESLRIALDFIKFEKDSINSIEF